MRPTTELERDALLYLNELRRSGITNMFGAAPYVEEMFEVSKQEARRILSLWMGNFNDEGNYDTVAE